MNRVLVAVDSSTDRRLIIALLESDPDFLVVGEAENGVQAVDLALRLEPDMIALDLDLRLMNGIEATQAIMERSPTRIAILSSSQIGPDLRRSVQAMQAGALTVIPRPDHPNSAQFETSRETFMEMFRVASRKIVGSGRDPDAPEHLGTAWTRSFMNFVTPFDRQHPIVQAAREHDIPVFGLPFSVEDRAERLRQLLDEIEGEF